MNQLVWIFKEVLYLGAMASVFTLLILLVKRIFHKALSAKWHYYIWILLLIRLLIPFYPESPISIYNVFYIAADRIDLPIGNASNPLQEGSFIEGPASTLTTSPQTQVNTVIKNTNNPSIPSSNIDTATKVNETSIFDSIMNISAITWISVVLLFSLYTIFINVVFAINIHKRYNLLEDERINNILEECKRKMKIKRPIALFTTNKMRTPSLYLFFKAKILVSKSYMEELSNAEIKYIFLHELSHYKRKDIIINWILTFLQIIYFFNPFIWYAFYRIHEDCEVSCDAAALRHIKEEEYHSYGNTIIKLIKLFSESNFIPVTAGIGKNKSNYKRRIIMISKYKKSKWISTFLTIIVIISVGVIGLTGCNLITKDKGNNETTKTNQTNEAANPTDTENNQVTKDPEQSTPEPEPGDQTQPVYYGEWVINQVQAFGIGTFSGEDAKSLIGKELIFTKDKATFFGDQLSDIEKVATNPIYTETVISEADFVANYRIPLDNLGIDGDTITEVSVTDSNGFVSTFFIKDENTLILYGGGSYFELVRKDAYQGSENDVDAIQTQAFAYVKSIDTENKTITLDQVELLFPTDEERLAEIGLKIDDVKAYYIFNEEENYIVMYYENTLAIELLQGVKSETASLEEFKELLNNREVFCDISLKDNVAATISEEYLP